MSAPSRAVLVPPRPNLGPEPLGTPGLPVAALGVLALFLLLAIISFLRARRRLGARRRGAGRPSSAPLPLVGVGFELLAPRERMIAWSEAVRESLVVRFGPAWRAKTTEEIGRETATGSALGVEEAARLLAFLREADRAKFAAEGDEPRSFEPQSLDAWEAWVGTFLALDAGASSKSNGR